MIFCSYKKITYDLWIIGFPIKLLTPERALVGCTLFDVKYLLSNKYGELMGLVRRMSDYKVTERNIKQWQKEFEQVHYNKFSTG